MNETATTSATYDRIAAWYAARWANRHGVLAPIRAAFVERLPPGGRVLDVGCGPGLDAAMLDQLGFRVCGLDRSRGMLAEARKHCAVPLLQADMRHLPCRAESFDGLWVSASFLHIPKAANRAVLGELRRVLRPGGVLYIGVKEGAGQAWRADAQGLQRFFVFYAAAELDDLLEATGFGIGMRQRNQDSLGREPWLNRLAFALS